jgi:hypothetical protein
MGHGGDACREEEAGFYMYGGYTMTTKRPSATVLTAALLVGMGWLWPLKWAYGHCDTMAGPVVKTAQAALDKGDVTPVLKWVKLQYEAQVREAFKKTLAVRTLSPEAKDLADRYFFETLVRLHREGEGAPYMGLKPAAEVEPVIAASDKALEAGSIEGLTQEIVKLVSDGIHRRFAETVEKKKHADESVMTGREFVEAYVEFTHYIERLHTDALGQAAHGAEAEKSLEPGGHQH